MGTILGINYIGVFFLIFLAVVTLVMMAGFIIEYKKGNRLDFAYIGTFLLGFLVFNCLVYKLIIDKEVSQRICIDGDIYIMGSFDDKFHIDGNYNSNYDYSPINSNEETVTIDDKIYEIITTTIFDDIFCRTVVDGITGWNIYKHTGNIVNGKIISLEYLVNQTGKDCK